MRWISNPKWTLVRYIAWGFFICKKNKIIIKSPERFQFQFIFKHTETNNHNASHISKREEESDDDDDDNAEDDSSSSDSSDDAGEDDVNSGMHSAVNSPNKVRRYGASTTRKKKAVLLDDKSSSSSSSTVNRKDKYISNKVMRSLSSIDEREQERQLDEEIVTKSIALGLDPFVERSNEFFYTTTATTIA